MRFGALAQSEIDVDALEGVIGSTGATGWDWITAGIVIVGAVVVSRLLRLLLVRTIRRSADEAVADLVGRLVGYLVVIFGFVYALEQVGVQIGPILGALGIVGIALAFALRDILENFVAGLLLQFRRPFSYGDQIISGDVEGTVKSIDARSVTVETPDGETVHIPSSTVITEAIVNHTERGRRRTTVDLGVAYGTDLRAAETTLVSAVRSVPDVLDSPPPEVLLVGFGDSSIDFAIRYWHEPSIASQWTSRHAVAMALDEACRDADIEIPFPQRVLWRADAPSTA